MEAATGKQITRLRHIRCKLQVPVILVILYLSCLVSIIYAQYGSSFEPVFEGRDAFEEVAEKLARVNEDNCAIMHVGDLKLPEDTVSHKPDIKEININPVFPNRTALLHLHNMALSRAFFFSYMLQSRWVMVIMLRCGASVNPLFCLSAGSTGQPSTIPMILA